ncbi:MAG TPA: thioredoxin [Candidatus Faeciplasma gallinarum]|uniref:Thioredoxin n=1 Tax=Candidatus Faeciplasma gallinarum TaxID=2840799 RepID=A0A9D1JHE4_9FIRM|nr:thioredoxin [Candidatus Faeciplasma gallinarum]
MAEIKVTKDNFEKEVLQSNIPVLLDFWATWCGPCQMIAPVLEEVAKEKDGAVKVGKINVDEERELSAAFGIASIPTLVLIKKGVAVDKIVGYHPKEMILDFIK